MKLIIITFAPIIIIAIYIYYKDKKEKEPFKLLFSAFLRGIIISFPIIYFEKFLSNIFAENSLSTIATAYTAFIVAGFVEEIFKFLATLTFWNNKNFNEIFDGIVYATFISIGFAAFENILYVYNYQINYGTGYTVAINRAWSAVPAHALFGVTMGYYLSLSKFYYKHKFKNFILALLMPIIFHGIYDFILMYEKYYLNILFLPYLYFLWSSGLKKIKLLNNNK